METLQSAIEAMRPNCYFGSVDLSEAFYSIKIRDDDRNFFRFWHKGTKYQFIALIHASGQFKTLFGRLFDLRTHPPLCNLEIVMVFLLHQIYCVFKPLQ